jgi:hypothetical protein
MLGFDLAQTFFLDRDAVQKSPTAAVTKVDLYFYGKPVQDKTKSGLPKPGASVYLCNVKDDGSPDLSLVFHQYASRVEYDDINTSTTGSTATTFTLRQPVVIETDKSYGILIKFDGSDPDFKLWYNKAGDLKLGTTTTTQTSSGKVDGFFYTITNGTVLTPQRDADLAFKLYVAKFTSTEQTFKIKNRSFEILKTSTITGNFIGGEDAYVKAANAAGTISVNSSLTTITGTGTSFVSSLVINDQFVITDGTPGNTIVRTVTGITNNTLLTIDIPPSFSNAVGHYYKTVVGKVYFQDKVADYVVLQDVNTNTSISIAASDIVYGVDSGAYANVTSVTDYTLNAIVPNFSVQTPGGTTVQYRTNIANTTYAFTSSFKEDVALAERKLLNKYPAVLASRTHEVTMGSAFASFAADLVFQTNNPYASPYVREENLDMFGERFSINNDSTNEEAGRGNALSKYVSKTITLTDDQFAEDLKSYLRVYKPSNTSILVYGKFRNSNDNEQLSVKPWTALTLISDAAVVSNPTNIYDLIELEYAVPYQPTVNSTATGTFTTTSSSAVVTGTSGTVNTDISIGQLVKVYSPLFPDTNYFIERIVDANTTTFTVSETVTNVSMVATGLKVDVLKDKNSAFIDIQNQNTLTYFNGNSAKFKGYDSFSMKIVLLSDNSVSIPFVDDLRAIAVSA